MDRQDAKPRRPSLLAGAQTSDSASASPTRSPPARILADMQDRPSGPAGAARTSLRLIPLVLALMVAGLAGWWWLADPPAASDGLATVSAHSSGERLTTRGDDIPTTTVAATIVDESLVVAPASALAGPPLLAGSGGAGDLDAVEPASGQTVEGTGSGPTAAGAGNPFLVARSGPTATTATLPPARERPPALRAASAPDREPDLLAILMGNIKPSQDARVQNGSGLDAFIQTMEAEDTGMASAEQERNGRPQRPRSQQIQQNLRECPAANTAKGLKCRQEICAVYAGRDPACPANG